GTMPYTFTYTIDGGANQTAVTTSGNSVTVPITTTSAHTFTYKLISVQDGSSTACVQNQTGTVSVIVSPVSVAGPVSTDQIICKGSTPSSLSISGNTGNVIKWQSATDLGFTTNVTDIPGSASNVLNATQIGPLNATIYFRAIVQSGTCVEAASNPVTITVNTADGGTVSSYGGTGTVCAGTTGSVILTGNSGPVLYWETSIDGINWIVDATNQTTYYNFASPGGITQTTWYRAKSQATSCAAVYSTPYKVTVNPRPGATIAASPN